jgi:cellulase (glycosyl hydrolase family 5)
VRGTFRRHLLPVLLVTGLVAVVGVSLVAAMRGTMGQRAGSRERQVDDPAACRHVHGPFHVTGTKVYGARGQRYIPYGISLTGLASPRWASHIAEDERGIAAAADHWCANTIRLQIRQASLVSTSGHIDKPFLNAITKEVRYAEKRGLIVVLNLQWQQDPDRVDASMPTQRSMDFWAALAPRFGKDPDVIFDIFNEPAQRAGCGWAFWHSGGRCRGHRYLGIQELADFVRKRASNLFWIEGLSAGSLLTQAWKYHITGDGPLEYSEHRPPRRHQYSTWNREFGYISTGGHAPVVEGEWADYARPHAPWACWNDAPQSAPRFLRYLQARGFGLIVTKLVKDQLVESENLDDPTHFRGNWSCTDNLDQGVGYQAQQWFFRQNS